MPPTNSTYCTGPISGPSTDISGLQLAIEVSAITIGLLSCIAILVTGCYGPLGRNNEWPLIRDLPESWKKHIYPTRIEDPLQVEVPLKVKNPSKGQKARKGKKSSQGEDHLEGDSLFAKKIVFTVNAISKIDQPSGIDSHSQDDSTSVSPTSSARSSGTLFEEQTDPQLEEKTDPQLDAAGARLDSI